MRKIRPIWLKIGLRDDGSRTDRLHTVPPIQQRTGRSTDTKPDFSFVTSGTN